MSVFKELEGVAKSVNSATDRLTEAIENFESAIGKLHIGVTASVNLPKIKSEDERRYLTYRKLKSVWGVYLETDTSITRLKDAPRIVRIQTVPYLKDLVQRILDVAAIILPGIDRAAYEVEQLTEKIGQVKWVMQ